MIWPKVIFYYTIDNIEFNFINFSVIRYNKGKKLKIKIKTRFQIKIITLNGC